MDNRITPPTDPCQPTSWLRAVEPVARELALIPAEWIEIAQAPGAETGPDDGPTEQEILDAAAQESLPFDRTAPRKEPAPDVDHLVAIAEHCPAWGQNPKMVHPAKVADVAQLDGTALARKLGYLWQHKARGLSDVDLAVQGEWWARSLSYGFFHGRKEPFLPFELREYTGTRSRVRQVVLASVCLAMSMGKVGCVLSAGEAFKAWGIPPRTFWSAIDWLCDAGLLYKRRRHKNNPVKHDGKGRTAPVHVTANWYGPGPVLLKLRPLVLATFGGDDPDGLVEAMRERELIERCKRAKVDLRRRQNAARRRKGEPPLDAPGQPLPRWAAQLVEGWGVANWHAAQMKFDRARGKLVAMAGAAAITLGASMPAEAHPDLHGQVELLEQVLGAGIETAEQLGQVHDAQVAALDLARTSPSSSLPKTVEPEPEPAPKPGPKAPGANPASPPAPDLGESGGAAGGQRVSGEAQPGLHLAMPIQHRRPRSQRPRELERRAKPETRCPPAAPPDSPRSGAGGDAGLAPAVPREPQGPREAATWARKPEEPEGAGAPSLSTGGAGGDAPPDARGSTRTDAATAIESMLRALPDGHPLRGWRP